MEKKNDPIQNIEELIIQLEKINLSPLPSSKKENEKFKKDANLIMSKIVLNFDSILKNKLRLNLTSKNTKYKSQKTAIINHPINNNQNNINIINPSVSNNQMNQFLLDININNLNSNNNLNINNIQNNNNNNLNINNINNNNNNLNINNNNINMNNTNINSINNNNKNNNVINHYWTYISKYFSNIPSVEFCLKYDKYNNSFNNKYEEKGMLWILISINEKSFHNILLEIYNQNFDKKYYEKNSLIIMKKNEILNLTKKLQSIHLIEIEKFDDYLKFKNNLLKQQSIKIKEEVDDEEIIFSPMVISKQIDKNFFPNIEPIEKKKTTNPNNFNSMFFSESETEFLKNNPNNNYINNIGLEGIFIAMGDDDNNVNENNNNNVYERKKTIDKNNNIIMNNNKNNIINQPEREIFKINKIYDFNANCIVENYYNFENVLSGNDILLIERKKSSFFDKSKFIEIKNENNNNEKNTKYELKLNPPKNYFYPLDKNYTILNENNNNVDSNSIDNNNDRIITKFDKVKYKNKDIHLTNSILYYLNNFYHKKSYFIFSTNNSNKKPISLENQNYQCYFCKKVFKYFLGFIPRENIYWCSYYLKYICEDCLSEEFSVIPDFIIKNWNFKKYPISKEAKNILEKWYEKPVIYITKKDQICKNNNDLYQAILLKKKIHIIFDLMKCDEKENIIKNILGKYDYLVLRENFFSLRDLVEINDMSFFDKINEFEKKLENHILNECNICHYEGGKCLMCENNEKIYAFDVENVIYCNKCKLLFHKNCVEFHACFINKNIKL